MGAQPATGSGGQAAPQQRIVQLGDYCERGDSPAKTRSGADAFCVRVKYTDARVWSRSTADLATDPHYPPSLGDRCLDASDVTVGVGGQILYCNPTLNGRNRGTLVWHRVP
ncbi:hypothetical protein GCM10011591_43870 [Nocardia camponoti]|uniref:Uncharacterized protein n=1 Tax=Nocardia camponoti TaxID=1616106 RepID=A0A917QSX3_9NOCA|nr:hypothetical protein GCM10011591_43870 [Nocardia camponoti]